MEKQAPTLAWERSAVDGTWRSDRGRYEIRRTGHRRWEAVQGYNGTPIAGTFATLRAAQDECQADYADAYAEIDEQCDGDLEGDGAEALALLDDEGAYALLEAMQF